MPLLQNLRETYTRLFPDRTKVTAPFFDSSGNLQLLELAHLDIPPNRERVNHFGCFYTYKLRNRAAKGCVEFELFMELHRRATLEFLRHGTILSWDKAANSYELQEQNARLLKAYQ